MATDSAPYAAPTRSRQLWQVPIFLIGIASLVGVYTLRDYWRPDTLPAARRQLQLARQELEKPGMEACRQAVQRSQRVLDLIDRFPQLAGETHFLAGTARLRLSEEPDADIVRERQLARQLLERARENGVPETDAAKLTHRLGKLSVLMGDDLPGGIAALEKTIEFADDPLESFSLLSQAYTRLPTPDYTRALEASKQHLDRALRSNDPRQQALARYRLGEMHFKLKNPKEARQTLGRIGTDAPPELFYAARSILAENYEETQEWANAARNWEQARQNPKLDPPARGRILYRLGRCLVQEQRIPDALAVWTEAIALGGMEGQASGLRLGEVKLETQPEQAVVDLVKALEPIQAPEDYRNTLVPVEEARQILERAIQVARGKSDWDAAEKIITLYGRLSAAGREDQVTALNLDARARALSEQARKAPADQNASLEEQAREQYRLAGLAYERAASKLTPGPEQAECLWHGAERLLRARQIVRAQELLTRYTQLEGAAPPERLAEAWYLIATTNHQAQQYGPARAAYQRAIGLAGPFVLKGRLGLARLDLAEGRFDEAERGLQDLLKTLRESNQPAESDVQEQTLFALAETAFQRQTAVKEELREYGTAQQRLLGALQQYPEGPGSNKARMMLALCYWNEARLKSRALERNREGGTALTEEERKSYQKQRDEFLQKSADQYLKVEETLLKGQQAGRPLSPEETTWLKQAAFWGSDCYFWMQKYEEAVKRYTTLADRYARSPEEMIALSQLWQCHIWMNQPDKATAALKRMRDALERIPDPAFSGTLATHQRSYWNKWLVEASKPGPATR